MVSDAVKRADEVLAVLRVRPCFLMVSHRTQLFIYLVLGHIRLLYMVCTFPVVGVFLHSPRPLIYIYFEVLQAIS